MRVLLTGGGTGGHIYPALAIAEALAAEPAAAPLDVLFVGTRGGLESTIVPRAGIPLAFVASGALARRIGLGTIATVFKNAIGVVQACFVVARFSPEFAVATGGYVAFPVMVAARVMRSLRRRPRRSALLELNALPGLTNRLLRPFVDEIWYALPESETLGARGGIQTGVPLRASFTRQIARGEALRTLGLADGKTTIVVLGGSQGARSLNDAVLALAASPIPGDRQIALVAGERDKDRVAAALSELPGRDRVHVFGYLDDPRAAYAAADLIVARSGASTLAEIAATATPAILVPYPFATGDHQMYNARVVAATGAARVLADADVVSQLGSELSAALEPQSLADMRAAATRTAVPDAARGIAARIVKSLAS